MKEMYDLLTTYDITPNEFYIMWYKTEKMDGPLITGHLERRSLTTKGFLVDNELTDNAKSIVEEVSKFFKKSRKKSDTVIMGENFSENIDKYNALFPSKRLSSGKNARSSKINVIPGMRWFFENTDFTWEEVIGATKKYVEDQEVNGDKFMTCSHYFVRKQLKDKTWVSLLADWCEMYRNGDETSMENYFKEKTF